MIDLRRLEERAYRAGILRKGFPESSITVLEAADEKSRALRAEVESLRARRNAASREIAKASPEERPGRIEAAAVLKERLELVGPELAAAEAEVRELALQVPNPAEEPAPDGGEEDSAVVREVGARGSAPPLDHAELGERLGLVDSHRAALASGSRFAYLRGDAVLLQLALLQWSMSHLVAEGFEPVVPPVLVKEETMTAAGFFPTDRHQVYAVGSAEKSGEEELFLVGTSEVPLSVIHLDETVDQSDLPDRYAGVSTCFRREAGTYGRDTRGIFRVHQFDKVEMFSFAHSDRSGEEHEALLSIEEDLVGQLGLPYRVVDVAAGDLGAPAARKFDIEVWLPSEGRYRELTSCSNYHDYSARRLRARFRSGEGTRLVHTLNGTACAIGRTLLFLFEHYQDQDGIVVPDVLRPWCALERIELPSR
jgi:seryl-tRNA synthetase